MSENERDVIVVGAGPAGAMTATILAQKGRNVLLLDKDDFPRDKTCGDAVPSGAIEKMWQYGMKDKIETAVDKGEFYPLSGMMLVSPKGHELHAHFDEHSNGGQNGADSYVAPRMYFDHVIQRQAVESGAEFCQAQVKEPIVEDGKVVGVRARVNGSVEEFRSNIVIGADGVTSTITRNLRPKDNQHVDSHRAVAIRAYIDGIEEIPGEVEFYLYDEILPGYAWIFPLGDDKANIGLGMRLDIFRKHKLNLEKMMHDFLAMPPIKKRLKDNWQLSNIATWQLNFGSQKNLQTTYDGAILVGDAAGLINPLTGGGIHNSIISAELAANVVEDALKNGDTSRDNLKIYEKQCHDEMWESMTTAYRFQKSFMHFPFIVDILVRFGKQSSALTQTFLSKL